MLRRALLFVVLIAAPVLVYRGVLDQPLESDARFLTVRNSLVTGDAGPGAFFTRDFFEGAQTGGFVYLSGYYRPIANTLFWIQYRIGGAGPEIYNLVGMLLHGVAAFLLGLLVAGVGRSRLAGAGAAGIWIVHPVHAFAVTEPAALADPLATVFYLGALLAFGRAVGALNDAPGRSWAMDGGSGGTLASGPPGERPRLGRSTWAGNREPARSWGWAGAASGLYLLALLSKESGITFPAAATALGLLVHFRDGRPLPRTLLRTLPLWGLFGAYLVWRFGVLGIVPGEVGYAERVGTLALAAGVAKTVAIHLARIVLPLGWEFPEMHPSLVATANADPTDPLTWVGGGVVVLAVVLALSWKSRPEVAFWSSLFLITYSPLARADNIGGSLGTTALLAQERWIYLPAVAVIGGLAVWAARGWSASTLRRRPGRGTAIAATGLALALGVALAAAAATHARVQRDPLAQLAQLYEVPDEALGRVGLANRLMYYAWRVALPQGDLPEAVARAERAVELVPDSPIYARGLAGLRGAQGDWEAARALVVPWLEADSTFLAEQAETNYRVYDDFNRVSPELWLVRGEAEANLGRPEAAVPAFCTALARGHPVELVVATVERSPGVELPLPCG